MTRSMAMVLAGLLAAGACRPVPMPVPVEGDIARLAGEWRGEYWSAESGRSGIILFTLAAGADTAEGQVTMIPRQDDRPRDPNQVPDVWRPQPTILTITFVRATGGWVTGRLDPYRDPECGCILRTTFTGRLTADTLTGTYTSLHQEMGQQVRGEWRAVRSGG